MTNTTARIQSVSNKNAGKLVGHRIPFKGNNTFGELLDGGPRYAVYSYGYHFPLYYFDGFKWLANKDKYSVTTSKHASQLRPTDLNIELSDTVGLKQLIQGRN